MDNQGHGETAWWKKGDIVRSGSLIWETGKKWVVVDEFSIGAHGSVLWDRLKEWASLTDLTTGTCVHLKFLGCSLWFSEKSHKEEIYVERLRRQKISYLLIDREVKDKKMNSSNKKWCSLSSHVRKWCRSY